MSKLKVIVKKLECGECGESKPVIEFCDPSASEPHCKECANGFWEMMGDDPCGKNWSPE